FRDNAALLQGGGAIHVKSSIQWTSVLSVNRSTFVGNRGGSTGGDIMIGFPARAFIVNSTFHDTKGSVEAYNFGEAFIDLSTFVGNSSHLGFLVGFANGSVSVTRSVLFGSPGFPLCTEDQGGTVFSGGHNRFEQGDTSCDPQASDQGVLDPRLMPLGDY